MQSVYLSLTLVSHVFPRFSVEFVLLHAMPVQAFSPAEGEKQPVHVYVLFVVGRFRHAAL